MVSNTLGNIFSDVLLSQSKHFLSRNGIWYVGKNATILAMECYMCAFRVYVVGNAYRRIGVKLFMYYTNPESECLRRFPIFNWCWLILIRPPGRSFSEGLIKLRKASFRHSFFKCRQNWTFPPFSGCHCVIFHDFRCCHVTLYNQVW